MGTGTASWLYSGKESAATSMTEGRASPNQPASLRWALTGCAADTSASTRAAPDFPPVPGAPPSGQCRARWQHSSTAPRPPTCSRTSPSAQPPARSCPGALPGERRLGPCPRPAARPGHHRHGPPSRPSSCRVLPVPGPSSLHTHPQRNLGATALESRAPTAAPWLQARGTVTGSVGSSLFHSRADESLDKNAAQF